MRHGLASEAELDALIVECRRHLAEPTTIQTSVIVIQAWGCKPSSPAFGPGLWAENAFYAS